MFGMVREDENTEFDGRLGDGASLVSEGRLTSWGMEWRVSLLGILIIGEVGDRENCEEGEAWTRRDCGVLHVVV